MNGKAIVYFLLIASLLFPYSLIQAQTASAEFISSVLPQKLMSGEQVKDGVQNLFLQDNRLYVANMWAGLQILDVSDVRNPKELGKFELTKRIRNVHVEGNYAFLSVEIEGVYILDVSNPAHIKEVSKIITPTSEAYWVISKFPNLFIAEGGQGVSIYNIREPGRPRLSNTFDTQGWAWGLFISGAELYVADKSGGMVILDVSNPGTPKKKGQFLNMKNAKTVQVEEGLAYVANGPDGLWILDVSNPEVPSLVTKVNVDGYIYHASKTGNTVFLSNEIGMSVEIIDVTDPHKPYQSGSYSTEGKVYAALKKDVYVYVAADNQTLILRQNYKPIIAAIETQTVDENMLLSVYPNAYDPDGDRIFFTITNLPEGAAFDSVSGELTWTPTYEQSGRYPDLKITVIEETDSRLSSEAIFEIVVNHINRNPSLPDVIDYQVDENSTITFIIPEGSDPDMEDQGRLTYFAQALPAGASFEAGQRIFSWSPTFEQAGVYTVDFAIQDPLGGVDRNASMITVKHVDRKPTLEPIADQMVNENALLTITLKGYDPDKEDQNALSYKAENLPAGCQFDPVTAILSWTPTFEQSGQYNNLRFMFKAGVLSDTINFNITVSHVNRVPLLETLADRTIDENKELQIKISGNDPDMEDQGKLKFAAENLPSGAKFNADSLLFSWTPTYEQSGRYENVIFKVIDPSGLVATATTNITVNHVNRVPVLADILAQVVDENQPITFSLSASDPDLEDQGLLQFSAEGLPNGALLEGATIRWTPTFEQSGVYPLGFTVSDGRLNDKKMMSVTVNHVNRPPQLESISAQTIPENAGLGFSVKGSDPDKEDQNKLKIRTKNLPEGARFDSLKAEFSWTPTFEQSGSYELDFSITDPAGLTAIEKVQVTVIHVNRTPQFPQQTSQVIDENSALAYNLIPASDPDKEDQGKLIYKAEDLPTGAVFDTEELMLRWTPSYEQSGIYTINFSVSDGEFEVKQPLKLTVNHINRSPLITAIPEQSLNENQSWTLTVVYSDPDQEDTGKLVLSAANLPEGCTFNAKEAAFNWTPTFEQSGLYSGIEIKVVDPAGLSDSKSFNMSVAHVNRPPVLEAIPALKGTENIPLSLTLTATDPDKEDAGKLSFSAANLPAGASVDAQSGEVQWTPTFLQAGDYSITFTVNDGQGLSAQQTAVISIGDVNRPPAFMSVSAKSVNENELLTFVLEGSDEDTDNRLVYSAVNLPEGASFANETRTFTWTPTFEQAGEYEISFKLSDGFEEVSQNVKITVKNINRQPQISGPTLEEVEAESSIRLRFTGSDPDNDELKFEAGNLPAGAEFDQRSAELNWRPAANQVGDHAIIIKVTDGTAEANMRATIKVKEKPQPVPVEAPADTSGTN